MTKSWIVPLYRTEVPGTPAIPGQPMPLALNPPNGARSSTAVALWFVEEGDAGAKTTRWRLT
jgi:hypothetical protein